MSVGLISGAAAGADMRVLISDQTKVGNSAGGACSAGIKVLRNGQYHAGSHNSSTLPTYADVGGREWAERESTAVGDAYQAILETTTGALVVGTADTWQTISTDREYNVNVVSTGSALFTGTLKIRKLGTTTVLDTAAISLTALSI